nr:hypothetical protein [uncultured Anaerostipes sp.]
MGGKSNIRGREQGERASCGKKIQYERKKTEGKDLLWIKKTIWKGRIIKKEPPRRNKSIRGGDKSGKSLPRVKKLIQEEAMNKKTLQIRYLLF